MFTVVINHKRFGKIVLENVIEIHYNYRFQNVLPGVKIAFEQTATGQTYDFDDILEFEALLKV